MAGDFSLMQNNAEIYRGLAYSWPKLVFSGRCRALFDRFIAIVSSMRRE